MRRSSIDSLPLDWSVVPQWLAGAVFVVAACTACNKSNNVEAVAAVEPCQGYFQDCNQDPSDACEANTNTDVDHCGGCGNICPSGNGKATCDEGKCSLTCNSGFKDCNGDSTDGCEIDTRVSVEHCGDCQTVCNKTNTSALACQSGVCVPTCAQGFADCNNDPKDACEVDTSSSLPNCGSCGKACEIPHAQEQCVKGQCTLSKCDSNYHLCGSICYSNTDVAHCGASCESCKGTPTEDAVCASGACATKCKSGYTKCGSACVQTNTDASNCGSCGHSCQGSTCAGGLCQPEVLVEGLPTISKLLVVGNTLFIDSYGLRRTAKAPTGTTTAPPVLVSACGLPTGDGQRVYFTTGVQVMAIGEQDASPTTVADFTDPTNQYHWAEIKALALGSTRGFVILYDSTYQAHSWNSGVFSKDGSTKSYGNLNAWFSGKNPDDWYGSLADDDSLFLGWGNATKSYSKLETATWQQVGTYYLSSSQPEFNNTYFPLAVLTPSAVVMPQFISNGNYRLKRLARSNMAELPSIYEPFSEGISAVVYDGTNLFFGGGTIWRGDPDGGPKVAVFKAVAADGGVHTFTVDDTHIYVAYATGKIVRVAK